ncbi:hypothetical protein [Borrelia puertoricensis]|uniref:hypothetical protein n=1 Tax=Borrelia puertoricensis TaxID=2756107 RepID=UPI001FF5DCB9|nr:hypothetical protein [Borrelia puertoricensis]UPA18994.1 hypothetical protein bpuSUM_001535 [Borrelia puertoricensis]
MVVRRLFLKLLFVVGLLVFFNACTKESGNLTISEDFRVSYVSNDSNFSSLGVELSLVNRDNSFSIMCDYYFDICHIHFKLKNEHSIYIKAVKLDGSFIHFYGHDLGKYPINMFSKDIRLVSIEFNFKRCNDEWKKLIADAKDGYLTFSIICVEEKSKLEKKYEFRVSAANLSKFIKFIDINNNYVFR